MAETKTYRLEEDEYWPVISVDDNYGDPYEMPVQLIEDLQAAYKEFDRLNSQVFQLMEEQDKARLAKPMPRAVKSKSSRSDYEPNVDHTED